ncbi:MAG: hypothetical protein ACD_10C00558G0002 [uncultured bacterium]|nr:MAG: hypothetical protein ACD_10C00558G0002 [uncultured bacterium]
MFAGADIPVVVDKENMMKMLAPRLTLRSALARQIGHFAGATEGSLTILALCLFFLMVMLGGIAIDLMRYEGIRTELQNTLDRCTLMAASLDQRLDPQAVVTDCVEKAGLADRLQSANVMEANGSRTVLTKGIADTKPYFLHLIGIDSFDATASSGAEQKVTNVEIALVLDVSGSMSGAKIANLKTAASEFVNTVLSADPDRRVSISIVPYNAQVNLGPVLRGKFNATHQHDVANVNCVELPDSVFGNTSIPRTTALSMMAYADIAYGTSLVNGSVSPTSSAALPNFGSAFCKPTTANIVRPPSQNIAILQAQINGLQAGGNTSITLGMKWGVAMLDPAARGMYSELINANAMPTTLEGRPFDYENREAMKVVVLMTDGEHVSHNRVNDNFKTGSSPIFRSRGDGNYSVHFLTGRPTAAGANEYWVPHRSAWQATAWDSGAGYDRMDWKNVWANLKMTYVAWQFYARPLGGADSAARNAIYNSMVNNMQSTYASVATMDSTLQQTCALAKSKSNVIIYGIAFEAPLNGQTQISRCASSPAHYFNAQGLEITSAFRSIASNLSQLKLTQ